ncbi:MAG: CCDC90 family protein [Desulfobulbaceae bacterium]|jgi:hypothetical protein|nr:CCDC90 family protein [Desulfobulbaceae bacterium]
MASLTFDTLELVKDLEKGGFNSAQTEAVSNAMKKAMTGADVATKQDIFQLRLEIKAELAPLKWGVGVCAAGIVPLVIKAFFS